jgi:hypothetical protein
MAVKNCWDEDTMLPCVGREHYRLSVTDGCRWRGGDGTIMPCPTASDWSILLTFKINN